jgi:hypothetical protein
MENYQAAFYERRYEGEEGHFIHIRYIGIAPEKKQYDIWYETYQNLVDKLMNFK